MAKTLILGPDQWDQDSDAFAVLTGETVVAQMILPFPSSGLSSGAGIKLFSTGSGQDVRVSEASGGGLFRQVALSNDRQSITVNVPGTYVFKRFGHSINAKPIGIEIERGAAAENPISFTLVPQE